LIRPPLVAGFFVRGRIYDGEASSVDRGSLSPLSLSPGHTWKG
jgi:hypothetical protein